MTPEEARDLARLRAGRGVPVDADPHVARLRRLDAEEPVAEPTGPGWRANLGLLLTAIVLALVVGASAAALSYGVLCALFGCAS